jgi:hypothetical protein
LPSGLTAVRGQGEPEREESSPSATEILRDHGQIGAGRR